MTDNTTNELRVILEKNLVPAYPAGEDRVMFSLESAEQAILAHINKHYISREDVVAAIGKDNYITSLSGNSRLDQQIQSEIDGASKLRQEIRQALHLEEKPTNGDNT